MLDIILLIGYIDRPYLFCSSKNLLESLTNPTSFCTTVGKFIT